MFGPRFFRRRWVLAVIFVISLVYFLSSIFGESDQIVYQHQILRKPLRVEEETFQWQPEKLNISNIKTCRNSVQGRILITDDRGYTCDRDDIQPGGCCDINAPFTKNYSCNSCLENKCCAVYEYCVSCCLNPDKRQLLRRILGSVVEQSNHLYASISDHFELCLAKCRTSSQSVQHENTYRDPRAKHCYGQQQPDLHPAISK